MESLLALVFPARCPVCGRAGVVLCALCAAALQPAPPGPVPALLSYDGAGKALVRSIKYRNHRAVVARLAGALAQRAPPGLDVVTWAPTTPERARDRGFDQAEQLARAVARELGLPCRLLLTRVAGPAQTGRPRAERLIGPRFSVRCPVGGRVLVVDDVVTTGATLRAAASTLRSAGADEVAVLALAATPSARGTRVSPGHRHEVGG